MAEQEKIRCKITDTKQEILKVYSQHVKDLNAKAQGGLDPEKMQAEKKKAETFTRVESVAKLDVPSTILNLQTTINQTLGGILTTLDEKRTALQAIDEAIKLKQAELQELYGIEKEAASLAALIESYRNKEEELSEEHNERMSEINLAVEEARKTFDRQRKLWQDELSELKRNDSQLRTREAEAYKYEFDRTKKATLDALNDEISKRNLAIAVREDAVSAREKGIVDLDKTIADLNVRLTTDVTKAAAAAEESAKKSAATAAQFAAMSHKAEVERLTSQLEAANARATDLISQVGKLQVALDRSNEKLQSIAEASLKSGADAKTIAELRSFEPSSRSGK